MESTQPGTGGGRFDFLGQILGAWPPDTVVEKSSAGQLCPQGEPQSACVASVWRGEGSLRNILAIRNSESTCLWVAVDRPGHLGLVLQLRFDRLGRVV